MTTPDKQRISEILVNLAEDSTRDRISLGDLLVILGDRGFGILILVLTLPNLTPIFLPGMSAVLGIPITLLSLQILVGAKKPWLPGFLLKRSLARTDFAKVIKYCLPILGRAEKLLKPRFSFFTLYLFRALMAVVIFILSILLALPLPFTGPILAFPLFVMSLALLEHDGLSAMIGMVIGFLINSVIVYFFWTVFVEIWWWIFG